MNFNSRHQIVRTEESFWKLVIKPLDKKWCQTEISTQFAIEVDMRKKRLSDKIVAILSNWTYVLHRECNTEKWHPKHLPEWQYIMEKQKNNY